ncbi:phosphatase PAP2 family protein [Candidatus Magnetomonas plexicatena]|uniref:phosphatase PAP2 family protein n=1 Tax=Candidatus Magnetomonas plexicatena TaxID=2552947 RepID=UPI001C76E764|nr:phosphatase PAP2 family protein [Nitrospirales bacterium LBB_01]
MKSYKIKYGFLNQPELRTVVICVILAIPTVYIISNSDVLIRSSIAVFFQNHNAVSFFYDKITPLLNFIFHGMPQFTVAVVILILGRYRFPELFAHGKIALISLCSSGLAVQAIKHIVGRGRPRVTETFIAVGPTLNGDYDSFPSGHTVLAFTIAVLMTHYFPNFRVPAYMYAALSAFHRVKTGSHFPSDVTAGAFVGVVIANIVLYYFRDNGKYEETTNKREELKPRKSRKSRKTESEKEAENGC